MNSNSQLFALKTSPSEVVHVDGKDFSLMRVLKHDFYAATCLYRSTQQKIIVKYYRRQPFAGISLEWAGRWMCSREVAVYRRLKGVRGIPRSFGAIAPATLAIEYIDATSLDRVSEVPRGFFDKLVALLQKVHQRDVAYVDANKRSNILMDREGNPWLVDFQISMLHRPELPKPLRRISAALMRYFQECDVYHFYKHKRRLSPEELSPEEETLSYRRSRLHSIHRKICEPYRNIRRAILRKQFQKGRLVSPTESIEDTDLPEKRHWRTKPQETDS